MSLSQIRNHPKVKALKQKLERTVSLALEKAVAHLQQPGQYPLPSNPKTLERAFYSLISEAPQKKRKKIIDKVNLSLNATASKRSTLYGNLSEINLKSSAAVLDQVVAIPVTASQKMTNAEIAALAAKPAVKAGKKAPSAVALQPQAIAAGTVAFFVDTLTCNKKSEIGKDEIVLEGVVSNGLNVNQSITPIDLGKFKKKEIKTVSANPVFNFDIIEDSTGSVQNLNAFLFLREKDGIRDAEVASKLALIISLIGLAFALLALGIAIAGTLLALTSAALFTFMLVSFFTGLGLGLVGQVTGFLGDDFSDPASDSLAIDSTIQVGDVINRTVNFEILGALKGNYTAALRWVKTS